MTYLKDKRSQTFARLPGTIAKVGAVTILALSLVACRG